MNYLRFFKGWEWKLGCDFCSVKKGQQISEIRGKIITFGTGEERSVTMTVANKKV